MKCRSLTAIVLAIAMLVSFGLCNWSVAGDSGTKLFQESGTVYDNYNHSALGNYHNWIDGTNQPYSVEYYGDTYPPSQLKGTTTYETHYNEYILDANGDVIGHNEIEVTEAITTYGGNGTQSIVSGTDNNPKYQSLTNQYGGLVFWCTFTNRIESISGNAYIGERTGGTSFYFN